VYGLDGGFDFVEAEADIAGAADAVSGEGAVCD
jgi:hypothetical protein